MSIINVPKNDYNGLLKQIGMVVLYEFPIEFQNQVLKELSTDLQWDESVIITERLMDLGKTALREKMWMHLTAIKNEIIVRRRLPEPLDKSDLDWIGTIGQDMKDISDEILKWCHIKPPLMWKDKPVIYRDSESPVVDVEAWDKLGRPKTWCILLDQFLAGYLNAMKSNNEKSYCVAFLQNIKDERIKQTST